jgi:hypothetical protein
MKCQSSNALLTSAGQVDRASEGHFDGSRGGIGGDLAKNHRSALGNVSGEQLEHATL